MSDEGFNLSADAAQHDANLFVCRLGQYVRELYMSLLSPVRLSYAVQIYEDMADNEWLKRFFAVGGLAVHEGIKPPGKSISGSIDQKLQIRLDLYETIPVVFNTIYAYAAGKGVDDEFQFEFFESLLSLLYLLADVGYPVRSRRREVEEKLISDEVSPRLAFVTRMYHARKSLELGLKWALLTGNPEAGMISVTSLANIANLSYTYIIKLIKTGGLQARKQADGTWYISPVDAAIFLDSRSDCPTWVREKLKDIAHQAVSTKEPQALDELISQSKEQLESGTKDEEDARMSDSE